MARVPRRVLGYTEHLSPSLSGALSSVDLGLMYDVLLARRWGRGAHVRSRTGGPLGWWALVHRDLLRAVRTPQPFVLLAGLVLVPYAAAEAGAGPGGRARDDAPRAARRPAMCAGLRVVVRTQSLARMLPLRRQSLLLAHLVVPGDGAAALRARDHVDAAADRTSPARRSTCRSACGLSSLAATVRWVTGKPPNYAAPMVSTPAGGVPTGVFGSLARGFDVWAFTALPLMFGTGGMLVSTAISVGVIAYLVSDSAAAEPAPSGRR